MVVPVYHFENGRFLLVRAQGSWLRVDSGSITNRKSGVIGREECHLHTPC